MRREHELPEEGQKIVAVGQRPDASLRQHESDDEGHALVASGHSTNAPSSLPNEDAAAHGAAPQGHGTLASASSQALPGEALRIVPQGHGAPASSRQQNGEEGGQILRAFGPAISASPSPTERDGAGQRKSAEGQVIGAPPSPSVHDLIRYHHRQRNYVMEMRKSADLKLGSFLRVQLGWSPDKSASERERTRKQAQDLIAMGEKEIKLTAKGKAAPETDEPAYLEWREIILASVQARAPFDAIEKKMTQEMEKLAETLPVWKSFGEPIKGFGARSLAVIVGEAGDLSQYATHSKLWKRMGLAVIEGKRQGGLSKSASKDDWIAHGYNRQRRSRMFVIGDVLIKNQNRYREIYLKRKDYERQKAEAAGLKVVPAAKIPAKRAAEFMSDGHVHKRAQRYMEKKLLRDLWSAWRNDLRAFDLVPQEAVAGVPAGQQVEGEAIIAASKGLVVDASPHSLKAA